MTDRNEVTNHEKLIEEAYRQGRSDEKYSLAFAPPAFEKAHTPTADEREALERVHEWVERLEDGAPLKPSLQTVVSMAQRSEVPEPSARCPKCGVTVTDQTPSTFYTNHDEACGGRLEEPRGEPSDATREGSQK